MLKYSLPKSKTDLFGLIFCVSLVKFIDVLLKDAHSKPHLYKIKW
jgi:hypothetical protein